MFSHTLQINGKVMRWGESDECCQPTCLQRRSYTEKLLTIASLLIHRAVMFSFVLTFDYSWKLFDMY